MAGVKAPQVFRKEWVEQVKEIFDGKKSVENADKIPRVATPLLNAKPEAYIQQFVSLGPYHHWTLEKKIAASSSAGDSYEYSALKMSTMEAYKVQSAAKFWQGRNKSSDDIIEKIKSEMQQKIEDFYDWPISKDGEYPHDLALMMGIDSSFLLHFLRSQSLSEAGASDDVMKRLEVSIMCDIMKLENQIPLFLLRNLFDFAKLNDTEDSFSKLLQRTYKKLSPFDHFDIEKNDARTQIAGTQLSDDRLHLLGCVHAIVSPLVQYVKIPEDQNRPKWFSCQAVKHRFEMVIAAVVGVVYASIVCLKHPYEEGIHDILDSYNAEELKKEGIKFKFFKQSGQIRFNKYSGTLYLPQITVSEIQTEVFFRNMLALELNTGSVGDPGTRNDGDTGTGHVGDTGTGHTETDHVVDTGTGHVGDTGTGHVDNPMMRYVGLMDCLIDTAEDVRLLRESQVIVRRSPMFSDESIAGMWNGLCHAIFTGHLEPPEQLKTDVREVLIRKYYMSRFNMVLWEFYWDHLSKPGKGVALFVGILLLFMTCAQTFFDWWEWSHGDQSQTPKG